MVVASKKSKSTNANSTALKVKAAAVQSLLKAERPEGNRTTKADRIVMQALNAAGYNHTQIAAKMGICRRTVRRWLESGLHKKEEKVHFLIAIGNGWKSKFEHLPLRRLVDRDENGKALTKTLATGRRKKGDPANKKLNLANEGQTWNKNTLMPIFERWARTKAFKTCYAVLLDNAPSHSAVRKFLQSKGIKILEHPPHSPDMNIIELVHQTIKQRARNHAPMNNHELLAAYKEEFRKFSVHTEWLKYVEKYPQVLQQIVDSKGMPTDY